MLANKTRTVLSILGVTLITVLTSVGAHGASYIQYALKAKVSQNQFVYSGSGGTNEGGKGYLYAAPSTGTTLSVQTREDVTQYVVAYATGPGNQALILSHPARGNTHGQCRWTSGFTLSGTIEVDCWRLRS